MTINDALAFSGAPTMPLLSTLLTPHVQIFIIYINQKSANITEKDILGGVSAKDSWEALTENGICLPIPLPGDWPMSVR